jgi:hypothetical protein
VFEQVGGLPVDLERFILVQLLEVEQPSHPRIVLQTATRFEEWRHGAAYGLSVPTTQMAKNWVACLVEPESYWYSPRTLMDLARRVLTTAESSQVRIAFSADLGPDLLAPWRHPTLPIAYADRQIPMELADMVPRIT